MAWHPFRNLGLKVVALVLGTLLWFTVSGQQAERPIPDVPVVFVNKPDGSRDHRTDQLRGHSRARPATASCERFRRATSRRRVDLTGARLGDQEIHHSHRSGERVRSAWKSRKSSRAR